MGLTSVSFQQMLEIVVGKEGGARDMMVSLLKC